MSYVRHCIFCAVPIDDARLRRYPKSNTCSNEHSHLERIARRKWQHDKKKVSRHSQNTLHSIAAKLGTGDGKAHNDKRGPAVDVQQPPPALFCKRCGKPIVGLGFTDYGKPYRIHATTEDSQKCSKIPHDNASTSAQDSAPSRDGAVRPVASARESDTEPYTALSGQSEGLGAIDGPNLLEIANALSANSHYED